MWPPSAIYALPSGVTSQLSPASLQSLALQGGAMSATEAEAFLALPHAREGLTLRRADDAAKIEELEVPQLAAYRSLVEKLWS
jgi:predicted HD phosphohydrolase